MKTQILYEDNDIIVCYKPAGIAVQTAGIAQQDMVSELKNYFAGSCASGKGQKKQAGGKEPYGAVGHRLDQPVSGVLVFAKNKTAAASLSSQVQDGRAEKIYRAMVCGTFEEAKEVLEAVKAIGAKGNISSIHVNTWFGEYDKLPMSLLYLKEHYGVENPKDCVIYFGDAANDEEMFGFFPTACGVANLMKYAEHMEHLPSYIASYNGGEGFCEAAEILLTAKKNHIKEKYSLE